MANSTDVRSGIGVTIDYQAPGASTWTTIAEVGDDAAFSGFETNVIEAPRLIDIYMRKIAGRIDPGTFNAPLFFVPTSDTTTTLLALQKSRVTGTWRVHANDDTDATNASTLVFPGFVSNYTPGGFSGSDAPKGSVTIAITGEVVITVGTAKP